MKKKFTVHSSQIIVNQKGFTLVEIMVVVVIFGIMGIVASNSLFSLLRGASKTEILKEVKQNGDYTLSVMEFKIRNAKEVLTTTYACTGTQQTGIEILNPDDSKTVYSCAAFGFPLVNRLQEVYTTPAGVVQTAKYLTTTKVTVANCNAVFSCTSAVSGIESVNIRFTLNQVGGTSPEDSATETFATQVNLRNN